MPALFLIPTPLGAADTPCLLPHEQAHIVHLTDFVVEAETTARAHLKHMGVRTPIRELNLCTLNEHTPKSEVAALLQPLREGRDLGLVSEAGCPAVADPGADLVALAHAEGFEVRPLVGATGRVSPSRATCRPTKTGVQAACARWSSVRGRKTKRSCSLNPHTATMRCWPMLWPCCIPKRGCASPAI